MRSNTIIQAMLVATAVFNSSAVQNNANVELSPEGGRATHIRGGQVERKLQDCSDKEVKQCKYDYKVEDCSGEIEGYQIDDRDSCKSICKNTVSGCNGWSFSWNSKGETECKLKCEKKSEVELCGWEPWHDRRGYGCSDYENYGTCDTSGTDYEKFGMTAQDACCACGGGETIEYAVGRPFVDSDDRTLVSSLNVNAASSSWGMKHDDISASCSESSANDLRSYNMTIGSQANSNDPNNDLVRSNVATAWSKRGLGEHASVASFAAFTLALMTNTAPPTLIRDALNAALDEVSHATASFEVASLFAGKVVEPGPLPPSSHRFAQDMSALALGAAREGCVDETLSVLAALAEADSYEARDDGSMSVSDVSMLKGRLNVIAEDEGRHSSLAWRTVRWACTVDPDACDEVKRDVFQSSILERKGHGLLESEELRDLWKGMYQVLIPFVTGEAVPELGAICGEKTSDEVASKSSAKALVDDVVRSVVCEP